MYSVSNNRLSNGYNCILEVSYSILLHSYYLHMYIILNFKSSLNFILYYLPRNSNFSVYSGNFITD